MKIQQVGSDQFVPVQRLAGNGLAEEVVPADLGTAASC